MGDRMDKETIETLEVGEVVTGTVTKVKEKHALVDVNYKFKGILPISEVSNIHIEKMSDALSEGDTIQVKVTKLNEDEKELVLSKKAVDAEKAWKELKQKFDNQETFEVEIHEIVKGGLVTDIGVRGFIPASFVENHYVEDFSEYLGKKLPVKIVEFEPENNKLILSHKAVLDEETEKKKRETLESLKAGEIVTGTVERITDFGVFVSLGHVDGLVHISELAHHHVESPEKVVKEGEKVKVKILSVDVENERVSLSIKETEPGPWEKVGEQFQAGDVVKGKVKRLVSFGAFVEIAPGVEGLVHISEIANRHIKSPDEVLKENEEIEVKILDINPKAKRVSLSIKALEENNNETQTDYYETTSGFSLAEVIGEQLKKFK